MPTVQHFNDGWLYLVFGGLMLVSLIADVWYLRRNAEMTTRAAVWQSAAWVLVAAGFGALLWRMESRSVAAEYFSAYLMEYSLSMDNVFVFVLILRFFHVARQHYARVLFYGILVAIVLRLAFIGGGVALVTRFDWILYFFGAFLIYTGYNILTSGEEDNFDPQKNWGYKLASRYLRFTSGDGGGKMTVRNEKGKRMFTRLFLVMALIGTTDIVFALDSIPAAFAITQHVLVIVTSNVLAVIGLRAMFFMLMHAVGKFRYLQHGISFVLMFIGLKMLARIVHFELSTELSLLIIVCILGGSVVLSLLMPQKAEPPETPRQL